MQQSPLKYYCYGCEQNFNSSNQKYYCINCDSCAIQINMQSEESNDPSKFKIYEVSNRTNNHSLGNLDNGIGPRGLAVTRTVVTMVSTATISDFGQNSFLGNLLRDLVNSGNRLVPATQQQIGRLQTTQRIRQCAICHTLQQSDEQENQQDDCSGFKLPCSHCFHGQCIRPWFQRANTCPVCRRGIHE